MTDTAKQFIDCLKDASQLLEDYPSIDLHGAELSLDDPPLENFDLTLFDEWSKFSPEASQKTPVRVIQHLSCTGGTVISKCIAGMPNAALLSEVHPYSELHLSVNPRFAPTDLVYLAQMGGVPLLDELSTKIFKADIDVIQKHTQQLGKYLIIREHSHSDYLVGNKTADASTIKSLLQDDYPLLSILTVRHPVDSYLSLLSNPSWVVFTPTNFDEYCRRYLLFLEHNENVAVHKYEDFVDAPEDELKRMCESLQLPFNEDVQDVFDLNRLSGDSGRTSSTIEKRERRKMEEAFKTEMKESRNYQQLCKKLKYDSLLNP